MKIDYNSRRKGWFPTPCPECGEEASAYGLQYEYTESGPRRKSDSGAMLPRIAGSDGGGGTHTDFVIQRGVCRECGHEWGPLADLDHDFEAIQQVAPEGAVYIMHKSHWRLVYDRNAWQKAGAVDRPVVKHYEEVEEAGFRFLVSE